MSVPPIQMAAIQWAAAAAGTLAEPWKTDSVVSGRVLEYLSETLLLLDIEGIKVEAVVASPHRIPPKFVARVRDSGPPTALEIMHTPTAAPRVTAALRERLPHQGSLPPLLADLHALAHPPEANALPARVREALARLSASIADRRDLLDPDVLRDTVRRSGVQLEHAVRQLARAPAHASTTRVDYDLKGALQRLVQALQDSVPAAGRLAGASPKVVIANGRPVATAAAASPSAAASAAASATPPAPGAREVPPPLLQLPLQPQARAPTAAASQTAALASSMLAHAQAALARIEIMQLQAHPQASSHACMIEIPVRGDDGFDVLQIRIDEDANEAAGAGSPRAANWTLEFTLDLRGLGPVQGQLRLRGVRVGVDLWARHEAAIRALDEQNTVLPRILQTLGLQLTQLRTRRGMPSRRTDFGRTLLDTSA